MIEMAAEENPGTPHFVVVGHPNKGKSTIVSTLAQDESVEIDPTPGTTQICERYPMSLGNRILYVLVDTPGFQRPRRVLEYLKSGSPTLTDRNSKIEQLLADEESSKLFPDETEILSAIMHPNAGIIYVVDGGVPYSAEYEPEMEILQWSGQPRMALINPIHGDHFLGDWERALRHYFGIVKIFNPIISPFSARVELLKAFGQLDSSWSDSLINAQSALLHHRAKQEEQAAAAIAEALVGTLRAQVSAPISQNSSEEQLQKKLTLLVQAEIKKIEIFCWKSLDEIFHLSKLFVQKEDMLILQDDIFSRESIRLFGLSKTQLTLLGLLSGGTAGALLDLAVGGASLLIGSALGASFGAVTANLGATKLLKFGRIPLPIGSLPIGSHTMVAKPSDNLNIAFILLARAITYYSIVSERAHGNRSAISYAQPKAPTYDSVTLKALRKLFEESRTGLINENVCDEIASVVLTLIRNGNL